MNTTSKSPHSHIAKPCPWDDKHRLNIENCDDGSVYVDCSYMDCPAYNVQAILEVWNRRSSSVLEELEALENEWRGQAESNRSRALRRVKHATSNADRDDALHWSTLGAQISECADRLHALIGRYREPK